MKDWNVIVTIYQEGYRRALRDLQQVGLTERSPYHNVLVMRVDDPVKTLGEVERLTDANPPLYDAIARVAPALHTFEFSSTEAFKERAVSAMLEGLPDICGRSFHARLHRRGSKLDLSRPDAERLFNETIMDATTQARAPARISFSDPDVVIAIDYR